MSNIFIGALFVFLNFTININGIKIGLIPDFIGYIIMVKGLAELENESPYFLKAKGFAKGMAVYTAILYAMDLFGLSYNFGNRGIFAGNCVYYSHSLHILHGCKGYRGDGGHPQHRFECRVPILSLEGPRRLYSGGLRTDNNSVFECYLLTGVFCCRHSVSGGSQ